MDFKAEEVKAFEKEHKIELPRDNNSERGVSASLIVHPTYIAKSDFLKPKNFINKELGAIYYIVSELYNKGIKEIDTFTILTEIENNPPVEKIFQQANIKNLAEFLDDIQLLARNTVEEYVLLAKNILSASFKRDSYIKLHMMSNEILESTEDINNVNHKMQNDISKFASVYICNKEIKTLGERADEIWSGIMQKRKTGFFGYPSKFSELNKFATYEPTELVLICASSKVGKSQALMNEALHKSINGIPSLYTDTELSTENFLLRVLANLTGIENRRIKEGKTTIEEEKLIKETLLKIKKLPLTHIYMPNIDMDEVFMTAKQLKVTSGLKFICFDYIKYTNSLTNEKEHQALGSITDKLKNQICGELELAGLGSAQLDRLGTKISDSSKVERYASTICYLHRKTQEEILRDGKDCGNMKLSVSFNRNGGMTDEGQYINLVLNGDLCLVQQAKIPFTDASEVTAF
jgi:replicative DNA helicase